jgi:hypothetical protein
MIKLHSTILMKKHNGMRPHDIVILLKIIAKGTQTWLMKDLANELKISNSEISESLHRSSLAGLVNPTKTHVMQSALLEFLEYGLRYVFPQAPGALVPGVPTAWSALPLSTEIISQDHVVWPSGSGSLRGQAIEPLHPSVPLACEQDEKLHELLALTDALRIGRARERILAISELRKRLC